MNLLEKERISQIEFAKQDVLLHEEEKAKRLEDLQNAAILGNSYKGKVKIYFKDINHNHFIVHTTIWSTDELITTLKGGMFIPNHAIFKVEYI